MNQILGLINSLEQAIRHLLSGFAIVTIWLLELEPNTMKDNFGWIQSNALFASFLILAVGFIAYSIYRMVFWYIGDKIAYWCDLSAPSLEKANSSDYAKPYAKFLLWRNNEEKQIKIVSSYLNYRWAVSHFTLIVALMLIIALLTCEEKSIIDQSSYIAGVVMIICLALGLQQIKFLFELEKELYQLDNKKQDPQNTQ